MKKWVIGAGFILTFLVAAYFLLSFYAVKILQPQLQKAMRPGITLSEINVGLTHLSLKGIQYEDPPTRQKFLQIEEVRIYPSLLSLFQQSLRIREVVLFHPSFFCYRSREGVHIGPWIGATNEEKERGISGERGKEQKGAAQIKISRIRIRKGTIDFEDRKAGEPPPKIGLRDFDLEIENILYPILSVHSPIELKGKVAGLKSEGRMEAKGWIDLKTMDLDLSLKLEQIDVKTLEPYYRKRVSAEVEAGYIGLETQISLKQRMIDASGQMEIVGLQVRDGGTVLWIPAETVISQLKKGGNRLKASFHVKGNLEDPKFNLQETLLFQVALSLAEGMGLPIKIVGDTAGTEGFMEGIKSIREQFKKKRKKR